jgi:hypothetical protein
VGDAVKHEKLPMWQRIRSRKPWIMTLVDDLTLIP